MTIPEIIHKAKRDIIWFVEEKIIAPYNKDTGKNVFITVQQKKALLALQNLVWAKIRGEQQRKKGISIMAGKGNGKDACTVWAILWFMTCFPYPKVPCVSVSADQLKTVLWSEISQWLNHSFLKDIFVLQNDKLFFKQVPDEVRGKEWFAFTKAANPKNSAEEQVESLQGIHADYLLQVVDEGSGVLKPVYDALENNMTGFCNLMWIIFNPMHSKGYAIDTQYEDSENWITFIWNSEDSEITNKEKIKGLIEKYGYDSNPVRMNVRGLPPIYDESTTIPEEWVLAAIDRKIEVLPDTPLVFALDCGAGGDKSIMAARRGGKVYGFKRNTTNDSTELANWAGQLIDTEHPDCVRVDTIGIGWAVEGVLREKKGAIVEAADTRRKADNPERFINKRAEMYWNLRERFEKGTISIPNDGELLNQISALKHEITKSGAIQIIDKKKMKKEIGHSPDELDAMAMLWFYNDDMISKKTNVMFFVKNLKGTWMRA